MLLINHREEMLRSVGMLQANETQRDVGEAIGTKQHVISRLWSRNRVTGEVAERYPGRNRISNT